MSLKLSDFTLATDLLGTDWVTGLDNSAIPASQNVKITKDNLLKDHALKTETAAVQSDLDNHKGTNAATAHPDGTTLTDLNNHKSGANQHPISGVTGLQTALDEKANTADLGNSASRDVGTLNSQVPPGDEPANAVAGHESSFDHTRIQTPNQKAAADAANLPSGANPYATINDIPAGGSTLHADLTDTDSDGHPGTVINIAGGVQGNAVSIAADGTLQDSGTPPGGSGTTNLSNTPSATEVTVESSSGTNTSIAAATQSLAGVLSAADKTALDGTDAAGTARPPTAHAASHVTGSDQIATFGDATRGLVPASGGGTTNFLRADGTFAAPPGVGGGDIDGSQAIDWSEAGQSIAATGNQTLDLDVGHHFYSAAAMTADKTINFVSGRNHTYTYWSALIDVGTNTPTFQFNGSAIRPAKDYNISDGGLYWFTFAKSGTDYVVSERQIP